MSCFKQRFAKCCSSLRCVGSRSSPVTRMAVTVAVVATAEEADTVVEVMAAVVAATWAVAEAATLEAVEAI